MEDKGICIVGLGGGGCKIIDSMTGSLKDGPTMVAISTDSKSLRNSRATTKLQIGPGQGERLGTGGEPDLGRLAAEGELEMIRSLFADRYLVFLVVGLGGGTGTGAAPVVLKAARSEGSTTLCFATLPFKFEGRQRRAQAYQAIADLRASADVLIIVPNDKLFESIGKENVAESFAKADEMLGAGISAIWKLVAKPGFINLDFSDLRKVVENSGGICTFGYGESRGKNRITRVITSLLGNPLLEGGRVLAGAPSLLVSIAGGPDLAVKEVGDIMDAISAKIEKDCRVFMGTVIEKNWKNKIAVTVIVSEQWTAGPSGEQETHGPMRQAVPAQAPGDGRRKPKSRLSQTNLLFEPTGRGRFKGVEPTIWDGEDLDIPTFVRWSIPIEK